MNRSGWFEWGTPMASNSGLPQHQQSSFADHLSRWWVAHSVMVMGIVSILTPYAQQWVAGHPKTAIAAGAIGSWLSAVSRSPREA